MLNKAILTGRLTKDIDLRKTQSGLSVTQFTVACNRRTGKDAEQLTDFINCVAWRQSAEFLSKYAHKGSLVGVDGRIQTRSYDKQDGTKAFVTEVLAEHVDLYDSKPKAEPVQAEVVNEYPEPSVEISNDDLPF